MVTYTAWAMYGGDSNGPYGAFQGNHCSWMALGFGFAFPTFSRRNHHCLSLLPPRCSKHEGTARAMYISVLSPVGAVIVSGPVGGLRPQSTFRRLEFYFSCRSRSLWSQESLKTQRSGNLPACG